MSNRIFNSSRNFLYGISSQLLGLILSFLVRTLFVRYLGIEYLGVNGLFSNILTILSLGELGFGTAMVYNMYKPLANNDIQTLKALMCFYKKVYNIIGLVVFFIGISLIPLLPHIVNGNSEIELLNYYYALFLINSVSSYFFAYKRSILNADQKAFICSKYRLLFNVYKSIFQILILIYVCDFLLFLIIQIVFTISENIFISVQVNKEYPFLKDVGNNKLDSSHLKKIKSDVKALVLSNIARVALNGSDNIIISAFVGIYSVGLYSNYQMILGALIMILAQISLAMTGSIGNFIAKESSDDYIELFKKIDFLNFFIYGFSFLLLVFSLNPFITIWLGEEYRLSFFCSLIMGLNFLLEGFLNSLWTFRTTMGLFTQGKYRPLFAAGINIVASIYLGNYWGLEGVLLGTTLARLLVNSWYDPFIIFKYGFNRSPWEYYKLYMQRIFLLGFALVIFKYMEEYYQITSLISLTLFIIVILSVSFFIFWIIYKNSNEYKYYVGLFKRYI